MRAFFVAGSMLLSPVAALAEEPTKASSPFVLGGYVETFYQWNVGDPSNGITNARGFDNRHNSITLSNAVLDLGWDDGTLLGRVALQVGTTPAAYTLAEPRLSGTASVGASGSDLWRHLQQALAGVRFGPERAFSFSAGLYLSPIGPESMRVRENMNWSRSNLFVSLPFYHSGARLSWAATPLWTLSLELCNGWNAVIDNNAGKSVLASAVRTDGDANKLSILYFGGVERPSGASEGQPWRHLVDAYIQWRLLSDVEVVAHADAGGEWGSFGFDGWLAGAVGARWKPHPVWAGAIRVDALRETTPRGATPIFWPVPWVASATATVELQPHERALVRLEVRHDWAGGDLFFGGDVSGDGSVAAPFVPNRTEQTTVTLGVTTWL